MLVLNSAVVPTLADLKAHCKNLLKTLEIAHYAFIVSDDDFGLGIPHFSLKSSHIQELLAAALNFKTFAAMQAKIKDQGMEFQERSSLNADNELSIPFDHPPELRYRLTHLIGTDNIKYVSFLSKYFVDYMLMANIAQNKPSSGSQTHVEGDLDKYLPLLKYLRVQPFSRVMRKVVEESYTFVLSNIAINKSRLTVHDHFPLDGWIEIAVLNNLIEESAEGFYAGYNSIKLPTHIFFNGSPRISQRKDIYDFLGSTSRIGSEYFRLSDDVLSWSQKTFSLDLNSTQASDHKVSDYELVFELQVRIKAIMQDFTPHIVANHIKNGTYKLGYDLYQIDSMMQQLTPQVVSARICTSTEYFLSTCKHHLKDLNGVLHLEKEEALLSVRHPSLNELSWRREVCDYAQNLVNAAKYFFKQCVQGVDELDLSKIYFNDFGLLMFDYDQDIVTHMYSLGREVKLSPYNFSIFFNLFAGTIFIKSEKIAASESKHMLSMSYLMLLLTKRLSQVPAFGFMAEMLNLDEFQSVLMVMIKRFDLIESKIEHGYADLRESDGGKLKTKRIYTLSPESLQHESLLLFMLKKHFGSEISLFELVDMLKTFDYADDIVLKKHGKVVVDKVHGNIIPMNDSSIDANAIGMDGHTKMLERIAARMKDGELLNFIEVLHWLAELISQCSYTEVKQALNELKNSNSHLYTILAYVLNKKGNYRFNEDSFKEISLNALKIHI